MITLAQVLSRVESSDNPYALRFEPATHQDVVQGRFSQAVSRAQIANSCSLATAQIIAATSWGRYQIMGFNMYADPGRPSVGLFLGSPAEQTYELSKFLGPLDHDPGEDAAWIMSDVNKRQNFASRYNGTGNVASYATAMISAYRALCA